MGLDLNGLVLQRANLLSSLGRKNISSIDKKDLDILKNLDELINNQISEFISKIIKSSVVEYAAEILNDIIPILQLTADDRKYFLITLNNTILN